MNETRVYGHLQQLENKIMQVINFFNNFQQAVRLDSTGKEIRLLAIQRLLIEKNIITEAELTAKSGDIIKEMQQEAEKAAAEATAEAAKPKIVPATPEQTAQVAATPADAPVVPPAAQ
ncbi:MAG: hypothetical protein ACREBR_04595 [bacterium]